MGIQDPQVDPAAALKMADAYTRYLLPKFEKILSNSGQQNTRQASHRSAQPSRTRSGSRFKTNQDIFDHEAEDAWAVNHGRL